MRLGSLIAASIVFVAVTGGRAAAQDLLSDAKALYDEAAYEEALKALDRISAVDTVPEVHQYRALCLVALGRTDAAERAIALVVAGDPFFTPNPDEVSPRVVSMFASARNKQLPQLVRRRFAEATGHFKNGERAEAAARIDDVLKLLDDSTVRDNADLEDLRLVATAFVELVRVRPAPPLEASRVEPVAAPAPSALPIAAYSAAPKPLIEPPIAIQQTLPHWTPPDAITARQSFSGAIKLFIDSDGKVVAATKVRPTHAAYDKMVLDAARGWLYRPATLNGKPVSSETTVEIHLSPQ